MATQRNDLLYAERQGIGGTIQVGDILDLSGATKEVEIDFGAIGTKNKIFTIADASVTATSKIVATISGKPTEDHSTDEIMILDLRAYANNIVVGVGFDIIIFSQNNLKGKFNINYTI